MSPRRVHLQRWLHAPAIRVLPRRSRILQARLRLRRRRLLPHWTHCGDEITCDLGEVPCGEKLCMPEGAVCCSDGGYCHVGEECFQNGFKEYCQKVGDNGSTTTGPTRTGTVAESTTTARDQSTASSGALSSKAIADDSLASTTAETQTEAPTSASTSAQGISFESVSNIRSTPGVVSSPPFRPEESSSSSTTTTTASSTSSATGPSTATSTSDGHVVNQNVMLGAIMALAAVSIMTVL
ncbi:hypothetical protein HDV57DRAFT_365067 [Trichoderma longibrachiatum]